MKRYRWSILLGLSLILSSAIIYLLQVMLFHYHRVEDTFFYMLQDLAFLPIQVLLVTLLVNQLLTRREKLEMQSKLNMVIGTFYSQMGTRLLVLSAHFDANTDQLRSILQIATDWTDRDFAEATRQLRAHSFHLDVQRPELGELKSYLLEQQRCLLTLLENPNLLEHETFTDLLWAICHLCEELSFRETLLDLPEADYAHLANDLQRAYTLCCSSNGWPT